MNAMESIASISAINEPVIGHGGVGRPAPWITTVSVSQQVAAERTPNVLNGMKQVELGISRSSNGLVESLRDIQRTGGALPSLFRLQAEATTFSVNMQVMSGVVTSLNQSMRTVLNAQ